MTDMFQPTLADQIAELERELRMRQSAYPRFVASGKLRQEAADRQTARLAAAIESLRDYAKDNARRVVEIASSGALGDVAHG